jgi:hypothetical protein
MSKEHLQHKKSEAVPVRDASTQEQISIQSMPDHRQHVMRLQRILGNQRTIQHLQRRHIQRESEGSEDTHHHDNREDETPAADEGTEQYNSAVATPLKTLEDLLTLVKRVEAAYPGDDWKGITTRIRKSYYDGFLWDSMIKERDSYSGLAWPPLSVEDYKAFTEAKDEPELMINGESVDIGHLFTGLDAMNFQKTGTIMSTAGVHGPSGATWGGDVGSALALWTIKGQKDRTKREDFYENQLATKDDMLGDIDGVASKLMPPGGEAEMGGNRLSDRLRWYYQGGNGKKGGASMRFTNFCNASGFLWTGRGSSIALGSTAVLTIRQQIDHFAKAFGVQHWRIPTDYEGEDLDWFTDRFVKWVEKGLAAENP